MKSPIQITETEFLEQVIDLAHLLGWRAAHFRPARTKAGSWITAVSGDGQGWPDLVLAKPGHQLIIAELKKKASKLTPEQLAWQEVLQAVPDLNYRIWRPGDWDNIVELLQGGKGI